MKLKKINYNSLNSRQKEIYNFQKAASILAEYGFNCIKLSDDWLGADFLADHIDGKNTLKVQLKSRVFINDKYNNKNIWIIFPHKNNWYLIKHEKLKELIQKNTIWLNSKAWKNTKAYSSGSINKNLLNALNKYVI